ncbi:RDD family protein [Pseudolysinimonas sp.]|uniref:RDD family protein n=1 Tax=Pseudolysinimonas sp. TaxID=2680009 RepID=UPI00286C795F|nr:RDD family protein [Pseudolysinimonas sp.]
MSDAPPPPPDGLAIFEPPAPPADVPAYGEVPEQRLAHPGLRALAFILDGVGTVALTIVVVFGGLALGAMESLVAILVVPLGSALLATVLTATLGITPGKWIARVRVVHVDTGRPIYGWALLRSLVIVAPILVTFVVLGLLSSLPYGSGVPVDPLFGGLIVPGILWIGMFAVVAATPRHRGLEDLAGRSVVVRR